jgi:hypothetical protein
MSIKRYQLPLGRDVLGLWERVLAGGAEPQKGPVHELSFPLRTGNVAKFRLYSLADGGYVSASLWRGDNKLYSLAPRFDRVGDDFMFPDPSSELVFSIKIVSEFLIAEGSVV